MKRIIGFLLLYLIIVGVLIVPKALAVTAEELARAPIQLLKLEWTMQVIILALVGGIIYSIFRAIQIYGGLIGNSLKFVGLGILFLAVETVNRVLTRFLVNYAEVAFGPVGEEIFFASLKAVGFVFLAIGFQRLTSVFHGPPKEKQ